MSDIFISYNNEDRARAQLFARALEGRGWSIFWDRTIPTGKTWRDTIGKELGEARCVIVLWSKTSIESEWVREEADEAKARRVLLPVRIDDVRPPIGFRGIQTADLADWKPTESTPVFDGLAADIEALIGSSSEEPPAHFSTSELLRTKQAASPARPIRPLSPSATEQESPRVKLFAPWGGIPHVDKSQNGPQFIKDVNNSEVHEKLIAGVKNIRTAIQNDWLIVIKRLILWMLYLIDAFLIAMSLGSSPQVAQGRFPQNQWNTVAATTIVLVVITVLIRRNIRAAPR
jgi:hypothetical protein